MSYRQQTREDPFQLGVMAFRRGVPHLRRPANLQGSDAQAWEQGWWGSRQAQIEEDTTKIVRWLRRQKQITEEHAVQIAESITSNSTYSRDQPITISSLTIPPIRKLS